MNKANQSEILFFAYTLEFLKDYLPCKVGRSPKTVKAYTDSLSVFRRWLLSKKGMRIADFTFTDCDKQLLLEFINDQRDEGKSASCCNLRLSAIRSYIRFAADKNVALESVAISASKAPAFKNARRVKDILSPEALSAMFRAPDQSRIGTRDRTILILLYDSAIRVAELVGITLGDLNVADSSSSSLRIHGKGNKERVVAITDKTARHLSNYLQLYHPIRPTLDDPLFYVDKADTRQAMSTANIERIVRKYAAVAREQGACVPDRVYPHMLRRTRATELYRNGVPLELVSRMLGHSSLETTKIYATPSIEMLKAAVEAGCNPMGEPERPLWLSDEDQLAACFGLR